VEAAKNVVLEPLAGALAVAAFLHNVIMAAQHHNATLCKEAWGKNYRRKSRSVRIIVTIIVTVIFLGALGGCGDGKRN
jgi:hypothetical protein